MKAAESMQSLYEIIEKIQGPIAAKRFVADCVFGAISELHEEKLPVTGEAIEERIARVANDFITVSKSKNDVA